jgi:hypothetical protein
MSNKNMKNIDQITNEITGEAAEAWNRSNGHNWHRLVLTSQGVIYWAEEVDQHSMSEAVWNGTDCSLILVQGQTWNGDDEQAYVMIEASPEIAAELENEEHDPYGVKGSDGKTYRKGNAYYGYNPKKWYCRGDLLSFDDAHPDISAEDYMADAIKAAEEFWAEKRRIMNHV